MTDSDEVDDRVLHINAIAQVRSLLYYLEQAARCISL